MNRINEISPPTTSRPPRKESGVQPDGKIEGTTEKRPARDLYALLRDHADSDETLQLLWTEVNTVPDWVDWDQIARGQEVFYRYGGPAVTGLAYQSLLGGMGAARVVETLARTGGFSTAVARHRLFETTQHILQCTKSVESIQPGGDGFASTIRVRLLHASVRHRILKLAESRPEYYDKETLGIPINDIDSVATIVSFSAALIWLSLPRQGIYLRERESTDYIALWRYIAYLIGCPTTGYFETPEQAKAIFESLLLHELEPTRTSQVLANNVIKSLQDRPPSYASADFLVAGARWLNGDKLCDALALPRPSLYYSALMAGQCVFFAFFCYTNRMVERWDKPKVEAIRQIFWNIVVKGVLEGKTSMFEFKYVPEYDTFTKVEESGMGAKLTGKGIEKRYLRWLLVAAVILVVVVFLWIKLCLLGLRGLKAVMHSF